MAQHSKQGGEYALAARQWHLRRTANQLDFGGRGAATLWPARNAASPNPLVKDRRKCWPQSVSRLIHIITWHGLWMLACSDLRATGVARSEASTCTR